MSAIAVASLSLLAMLGLIWAGMHVAVVLGLVSFVGVWLIRGDVGVAANLLAQASQDAIASHIFGVVPLFVLTGFLVARADIGKDAFEVANQLFRRLRGGLGVATVASNAVPPSRFICWRMMSQSIAMPRPMLVLPYNSTIVRWPVLSAPRSIMVPACR